MFPFRTVEIAFERFQTRREPRALAAVFDRTAPDLLALARHLAPPGTEPEDLVQATFVTAIEAADTHRHGERVLPWLCGILGNHARAARRRGRRTVDAARLPQGTADAGVEAEASELRAEIAAAIDRLPEVYRPVLRLVFEHGLQAQEVARALERPAGTVRAQVTRGLQLLRRTLPASLAGSVAVAVAQGRGLAAVRQSVLGKVGGTGVGAVSPLFVGGLIVLHHKLFAAGAAVLVAALGLFWFVQEPPPPMVAASGSNTWPAAASAPIDARRTTDTPAADRDRVAEAAPTAPAPDPAASQPGAPAVGSVQVHVRDERGQALPGIGVALYPLAQLQDLGRPMDYVTTDANGEVLFTGLARGDWAIDVDRTGTSGVVFAAPPELVRRDITLPAGVRVEGRVVDRAGAPVAGATIVLHGNRATTMRVATSDAEGTFRIEHLIANTHLQARLAGHEPSLAHPVLGSAGSTQQLRIVLGAPGSSRTIRGRVLDADGRPVADATVAMLPASAREARPYWADRPQVLAQWLHTDAAGTFVATDVGIEAQIVFARALPLAPAWVEVAASPADAAADLQLPRGGAVVGTVRREGKPLAAATALAYSLDAAPIGYLQNLFGIRHATTGKDGSFRIDGLLPGNLSLRLVLENSIQVQRQTDITLGDGETYAWNVDLDATANLKIVLHGERPPADVRIVALVRSKPLRDGEAPSLVPIQSDGTGELQVTRDGDVDVILTAMPGGMSMVQFAMAADVPQQQREVVFELRAEQLPKRRIVGRLVDAKRAPVAASNVTAYRFDANGLVVRLDATTAEDGSFALGPLPAGDYHLLAGSMQAPVAIGRATLTQDRDEAVGDLTLPGR